jgi:uncharacterized protein YbcI
VFFLFLSRGLDLRGMFGGQMRDQDRQALELRALLGTSGHGRDAPRTRALVRLANEMVKGYKHIFGRGPARARASWAGPDTLLCTLVDNLTPAERRVREPGHRVGGARIYSQHTDDANFRQAVERITGREVKACVSSTESILDLSVEVFHLEPLAH